LVRLEAELVALLALLVELLSLAGRAMRGGREQAAVAAA
jgi:hypothetical protein